MSEIPSAAERQDADGLQSYLELLGLLVREPSVVGMEDNFFRVLGRELEELPVKITRYYGLLIAEGKEPESAYVAAHIDRHGLLCTGPNEFQYAAFIAANRGDLNGDSISEQFMGVIAGRFHGQRVQAHSPFAGSYLGQGVIDDAFVCPRRRNLIFNVEGLEFLQPGAVVSFVDRLRRDGELLSAQLDNVACVALVLELFRRGYQGTAFFTAGEEAGRSWRYLAEWFQRNDRRTDRLLVLDTSPFPDQQEMERQDIVLRYEDANGTFNRSLADHLKNVCEKHGIRYRFKDRYIHELNQTNEKQLSLGRTELGRLVTALPGIVNGTTLQIPTISYHTQFETMQMNSVNAMLRLVESI